MSEIARAKATLRADRRAARRAIPPEEKARASLLASEQALTFLLSCQVRVVSLFGALPEELDPAPLARGLLREKVLTVYPRVEGDSLGFYPSGPQHLMLSTKGIPEPATTGPETPLVDIDAFLLPGIAFDEQGARLGFGKGYYDRVLERARPDALRVGFAFECQVVARVPTDTHDQAIHALITERRLRRFSEPAR